MKERKANWLIKTLLDILNKDEIVLKTAYYRLNPSEHTLKIRLHAQTHVLQWEEYGILFAPLYLFELMIRGYKNNRFEVEAREREARLLHKKGRVWDLYIMSDDEYLDYCYKTEG